mgnify:CR=1 FL=1
MEIAFNSIKNNGLQFKAAKDLHLGYIARKRAHLLPQRVLNRVNAYVAFETGGTSKLPTLRQVHNDVYEALMSAKTLEEVKSASMYPEFIEVGNLAELPYRFSRSKKLIEKQMPLEDFALDCLKKIWSGKMVDDISKSYGFKTRDVFTNLCEHLKIPRPSRNYNTLLKASEEEGNSVIAEKTMRHIEQCKKNLSKAGNKHLEPEALAKQAESMREYYCCHPELREQKSEVMRLTWELCPEIREAYKAFLVKQPKYVHQVFSKVRRGAKLTEVEKRIRTTYYKMFWDAHPETRQVYAEAKTLAEKMLKGDK